MNPSVRNCTNTPPRTRVGITWEVVARRQLLARCRSGVEPRRSLIYAGCHGDDEKGVVEDAIELYRREGRPLPPPTSGRDFANKMQNVA